MDKRRLIYIIEWVIALAACGWLVWKLATYEDYAALGECLRSMSWPQWLAIAACVALMPVNMALEAWRWRTLWNDEMSREQGSLNEPLTLNDAQRQVYYSKLAGLITPWRLGEYPARGLLMNDEMSAAEPLNERPQGELNGALWAKVLAMGAAGSATMTAAIVIAGLLGIAVQPSIVRYVGGSYLYTVGGAMILLTGAFFLMPRVFRQWADLHYELLFRSLFQSFVRLLCWCVQLGLVLYALGAVTGYGLRVTGCGLPIYYLLVTITPNVPVVEAGVRGAWAMAVFGTTNAALAGVLLWAINTLLPCAIGLFLRKK